MPTLPSSVSALRQLLAGRFPTASHGAAGAVLRTGLPALDAAAGGLPRGVLTEIVCAAPSCGGQLIIGQLLRATRESGLRLALIDGADTFDPHSWPEDWLVHLVWVRARSLAEAMQVADLVARDANFGLVVLDLRGLATREVQRLPSRDWYRLQRAAEQSGLALVVETPAIAVPSAALRLVLSQSHRLEAQAAERGELTARLNPERQRQRLRERETIAAG